MIQNAIAVHDKNCDEKTANWPKIRNDRFSNIAGIGFAFQQPPRFKGMTVRRFLNLAAGRSLTEDECCGLLGSVGLCAMEYIDREVDATLSGGEPFFPPGRLKSP